MPSQLQSPAVPSTTAEKDDSRKCEICVICRESLTSRCDAQPCGHGNFDYLCLATWLEFRASCPLCQSTVDEIWYHSDGENDGREFKVYKVPRSSQGSSNEECRQRTESPVPLEAEWLHRRRHIYQHNLYALHIGSNRRQTGESQYTELSPELFMRRPELVSRARVWLRRELRIFDFLNTDVANPSRIDLNKPTKAEYVREYVIFLLKSVDTQDHTGRAVDLLSSYLGRDLARHFLHELRAWLRSPFQTPEEWDRAVQYPLENIVRESDDRVEREDRELTPRPVHRIAKRQDKSPRHGSRDPPEHVRHIPSRTLSGRRGNQRRTRLQD